MYQFTPLIGSSIHKVVTMHVRISLTTRNYIVHKIIPEMKM